MKTPYVPDAERFRNQATGIGQTRGASERTGAIRSQRVVDGEVCATPEQLSANGYPQPLPELGVTMGVIAASPVPLKRAGR